MELRWIENGVHSGVVMLCVDWINTKKIKSFVEFVLALK